MGRPVAASTTVAMSVAGTKGGAGWTVIVKSPGVLATPAALTAAQPRTTVSAVPAVKVIWLLVALDVSVPPRIVQT